MQFDILLLIIIYPYKFRTTKDTSLIQQEFKHQDSKDNIAYNYQFIRSYIQNLDKDKADFCKFILENCYAVKIVLCRISEAFQLFDSQNARGRTLEPSNLLKAFHLRSMDAESPEKKKALVEKWEYYDDQKILDKVLGEHLFRLRRWVNKEFDYYFTKDEIDEFKGINIIENIKKDRFYPYVKSAFSNSQSIHYQIQEPIVNGRRFFEYVLYYIQLYTNIKQLCSSHEIIAGLFNYSGINRTGDQYIMNLFENIWLLYYDKFGQDENFIQFAKELYRWGFSERVNNPRVSVGSITKLLGQTNNPLYQVLKWYYPHILLLKVSIPILDVSIDENGNVVDAVKNAGQIYDRIKEIEVNQ